MILFLLNKIIKLKIIKIIKYLIMTLPKMTNVLSMSFQTSFLKKTSPLRQKYNLGEVEEVENNKNK